MLRRLPNVLAPARGVGSAERFIEPESSLLEAERTLWPVFEKVPPPPRENEEFWRDPSLRLRRLNSSTEAFRRVNVSFPEELNGDIKLVAEPLIWCCCS